VEALKSGKLGGLGLDAFEEEPPVGSPFLAFDQVVATPHVGAHTAEAIEQMGVQAVINLIRELQRRPE
jgi:phosphoglycerate dehydrogenase-like enzyme